MKFEIYGPLILPKKGRILDSSALARRGFWDEVETAAPGLSWACGVYMFVAGAKRGARPWYVGRATKQGFRDEATGVYQINRYNEVISERTSAVPQLFLIAKHTPTGRFAKPSKNSHPDVEFLETFMFGIALNRNTSLLNMRDTKFLKNIIVPGVWNTPQRAPTLDERKLKSALGLPTKRSE